MGCTFVVNGKNDKADLGKSVKSTAGDDYTGPRLTGLGSDPADLAKLVGSAVILGYEEANRGTVFIKWIEDIDKVSWDEKPLAYFNPGKEVPKHKFKGVGAKQELIRDASGKNLYTAYLEYIKKAQEFDGDVVMLRSGSLEDAQGFVQIVTCDGKDGLKVYGNGTQASMPEFSEDKGYWRQKEYMEGPEDAIVKLQGVQSVCVVGGDNQDFVGVSTMPSTAFVIKGESLGRGAAFRNVSGLRPAAKDVALSKVNRASLDGKADTTWPEEGKPDE